MNDERSAKRDEGSWLVRDLGVMPYRHAWAVQEESHAQVLAGGREQLLLVEHPPVITLGRRPGLQGDVLARADALAGMGVEVVESDRGGQVTFHGPGQLVIYPIVRLASHRLTVGCYVHGLEQAIVDALATWGVHGVRDPAAIGVWAADPTLDGDLAKVAAIGVRVRRGVTLHGLALNVTTDLRHFNLIIPCGMRERKATSLHRLCVLSGRAPVMDEVKRIMTIALERWLIADAQTPCAPV